MRSSVITYPAFRVHAVEGHMCTLYLVEYRDRMLLLDGGARSDARLITRYITEHLQRPMADLHLIVVTHAHPDHAGGAPLLRSKHGIPVAAFATIDRWYSGVGGFAQYCLDLIFAQFMAVQNERRVRRLWFRRRTRPDHFLADGETLPGFPDWNVFHTPGHTSHDIVIYNGSESLLYAADMVIRIKNSWLPPFPVTLPRTMRRSYERLMRLPVRLAFLSHGGVTELSADILRDVAAVLDKKIRFIFVLAKPLTSLPGDIRRYRKNAE